MAYEHERIAEVLQLGYSMTVNLSKEENRDRMKGLVGKDGIAGVGRVMFEEFSTLLHLRSEIYSENGEP